MNSWTRLAADPGTRAEQTEEATLERLLTLLRTAHPQADTGLVERAYRTAAHWHLGQRRLSRAPFITHPLAVAEIIAGLGMDHHAISAALLHDLLEDTTYPRKRVGEQFGGEIAQVLDALLSSTDVLQQAWALLDPAPGCNQLTAMDTTVLTIKLADRLHNMRTLAFVPRTTQWRKAQQTFDLHVPLADALGLDEIGSELRDLAHITMLSRWASENWSSRALAATTVLLPAGLRIRWLEEWTGELATLPTRRTRTAFTLQTLLGLPRLSLALRRRSAQW